MSAKIPRGPAEGPMLAGSSFYKDPLWVSSVVLPDCDPSFVSVYAHFFCRCLPVPGWPKLRAPKPLSAWSCGRTVNSVDMLLHYRHREGRHNTFTATTLYLTNGVCLEGYEVETCPTHGDRSCHLQLLEQRVIGLLVVLAV